MSLWVVVLVIALAYSAGIFVGVGLTQMFGATDRPPQYVWSGAAVLWCAVMYFTIGGYLS